MPRVSDAAPAPRTLGPIADLEHHLPPDWWRTLFGAVYLKTDGDVIEDQSTTREEIDEVASMLKLRPTDRVLDLCCGHGRHSLELARRGFDRVVGVDRSRYLIKLARRRAAKSNLKVRFHEGDARRIGTRKEEFDVAMVLGNSFGYFDKAEDDLAVLRGLARVLKPGGRLFLDVTDGAWMREHFEPRSWEWIDASQFVCRERALSSDRERLISREVVVHSEKGVVVDQFYAERLYGPAQLEELLARAGFENLVHGPLLTTPSARDQDLGMMARRVRLTASTSTARKVRRSPPSNHHCVVLLGDPRLPDEVKLGGKFSEEDIRTVERLKEALAKHPSMKFEFLDEHETFLSALRDKPPRFALNLCDEGYKNDATMELHVPAYLDVLGIPYSGSAPACLALCYDKEVVRALAASLDIPVPFETSSAPGDSSGTIPAVFPAILKPARGDSSLGITQGSFVRTPKEAVGAYSRLSQQFPTTPILVQEFLSGAEYSVGIIGNPGIEYRVLPILRVDYSELPADLPPILAYESKWQPDSPYWSNIKYVRAD